MMKLLVCILLVALNEFPATLSRPQDTSTQPPQHQPQTSENATAIAILSQTEIINPDGSFYYKYETANGIQAEENSVLKKLPRVASRSGGESENDTDEVFVQVQNGSYSYTAPDGTKISLSYIADENGFQPKGDHLPTVPAAFASASQNVSQPQPQSSTAEPQVSSTTQSQFSSTTQSAVSSTTHQSQAEVSTPKSQTSTEQSQPQPQAQASQFEGEASQPQPVAAEVHSSSTSEPKSASAPQSQTLTSQSQPQVVQPKGGSSEPQAQASQVEGEESQPQPVGAEVHSSSTSEPKSSSADSY